MNMPSSVRAVFAVCGIHDVCTVRAVRAVFSLDPVRIIHWQTHSLQLSCISHKADSRETEQ